MPDEQFPFTIEEWTAAGSFIRTIAKSENLFAARAAFRGRGGAISGVPHPAAQPRPGDARVSTITLFYGLAGAAIEGRRF